MDPPKIIAAVNKKNSHLEEENNQLHIEINDLRCQIQCTQNAFQMAFHDQGLQLWGAQQYITYLQSYIAYFQNQSEHAMEASRQTTEFFEGQLTATGTWTNPEASRLSSETRDLNQKVLTMIEAKRESEECTRKLVDKIAENELNISLKQTENNQLHHKLETNRKQLHQHQETTSALIKARDDLNRMLGRSNDSLRAKAGKAKKTAANLGRELREAEAALKIHNAKEMKLSHLIKQQEILQSQYEKELIELRSTTEFYRSQDETQGKTITSLRSYVKALEASKRNSVSAKKISDQDVEITQLRMQQEKSELELSRLNRLFSDSIAKCKANSKLTKEVKLELATLRGQSLAMTKLLLDSLSKSKWELALKIVRTCYSKLEGMDNPKKAENGLAAVRGYLSQQRETIDTFTKEVNLNGLKVLQLILDMEEQLPLRVRPEPTKSFVVYVRDLKGVLEKEEASERECSTG